MRLIPALCIVVLLSVGASSPTVAETGVLTQPGETGSPVAKSAPRILTGKERLGEKATDEQRMDNCKVPIGKRGPKSRPEKCIDVPTS